MDTTPRQQGPTISQRREQARTASETRIARFATALRKGVDLTPDEVEDKGNPLAKYERDCGSELESMLAAAAAREAKARRG